MQAKLLTLDEILKRDKDLTGFTLLAAASAAAEEIVLLPEIKGWERV